MQIQSPATAYDLVIVGGGMVGASFACLLGETASTPPLRILVVEASAPGRAGIGESGFDARSTALSLSSRQIFEQMALWPQLQDAVTPIREIQISDKGHFGATRINAREQGQDALGYVVENQALNACLNTVLQDSGAVDYLTPGTIESIEPQPDGMLLQVNVGSKSQAVRAGLVVLADGGKSPICSQLGIVRTSKHYEQYALIANIAFEKPHNNIAFERFTDTGPLAVLPLASVADQPRGSLVWMLTEQQSRDYQALPDTQLLACLMERFGNRLGRIQQIGERFCYPLSLSLAAEQVRPGLALLGNVAHTLHPVAGQGLNLALRDARTLADTILRARSAGEAPGDMVVLQRYLQRQQADQDKTIGFTDYTSRLFSSNNQAKVLARKFGILAIDLIPPLRREFARQAMGLGG